jgi:hypothetical protein
MLRFAITAAEFVVPHRGFPQGTGPIRPKVSKLGTPLGLEFALPRSTIRLAVIFLRAESILVHRLLKRGNFSSVADLLEHILACIAYFNL